MKILDSAIQVFRASIHYSDLLDSFSCNEKLDVRPDDTVISEAIYFHICKMKYAGWRHRVNFNRGQKHSFSQLFQDIIAFYLRVLLPKGYKIELEPKVGKTQPDIAIKLGNEYVFIIEAKTNVGWDRLDENTKRGQEAITRISDRIHELADNFRVPEQNIIYIFEEHSNVSRKFSSRYWDGEKRMPRPTDFPFLIIFPLFDSTDPYYWKWEAGFDKTKHYKEISDELIKDRAKHSIVTPFEEIVELVINTTIKAPIKE